MFSVHVIIQFCIYDKKCAGIVQLHGLIIRCYFEFSKIVFAFNVVFS